MAKRPRKGSVYSNHRGTIVARKGHLYEASTRTSQKSVPERDTATPFPESADAKQRQRLRKETETVFRQLAGNKIGELLFLEVEKLKARHSLESRHPAIRRHIAFHERTMKRSFLGRRKVKKSLTEHLAGDKSLRRNETLGAGFFHVVESTQTTTLIKEHEDAVFKVLELVRSDETAQPVVRLRAAAHLSAAVEIQNALANEILRRVGDLDEDALSYAKNLPDMSLRFARKEREIYGDNFLKPWKPLSAAETMAELGCDEETLVVYLWSGMVDRILTEDEMVNGEKENISEVSFCALSVEIMKENSGG